MQVDPNKVMNRLKEILADLQLQSVIKDVALEEQSKQIEELKSQLESE